MSLKNHCENNDDFNVDMNTLMRALDLDNNLFNTSFRNCMMHYGIEGEEELLLENVDDPLNDMVAACFNGISFESYYSNLRALEDKLIKYLEGQFDTTFC